MTSPEDGLSHLYELLGQEISSCERLLELNHLQREVLAAGHIDVLQSLLHEQADLLTRLQTLDEEVEQGKALVGRHWGQARPFRERVTRLRALGAQLRELSESNRALLLAHFAVTDERLRFLTPLFARGDGYSQHGEAVQTVTPPGTYCAKA